MSEISQTALSVFRDWVVDGLPASGPNEPAKSEIRSLFTLIEERIGGAAAGLEFYATKAALDADTGRPAGTLAYVYDDATAANNAVYHYESDGWVKDDAYYNGVATVVQPIIADALAKLAAAQAAYAPPKAISNNGKFVSGRGNFAYSPPRILATSDPVYLGYNALFTQSIRQGDPAAYWQYQFGDNPLPVGDYLAVSVILSLSGGASWPTGTALRVLLDGSELLQLTQYEEIRDANHRRYHGVIRNTLSNPASNLIFEIDCNSPGEIIAGIYALARSHYPVTDVDWVDDYPFKDLALYPDNTTPVHTSGTNVVVGDSMIEGTGGVKPIPQRLSELTGKPFANKGVIGQKTDQIAGRMGAQPILLSVQGNTLPAGDGSSVALTALNIKAVSNTGPSEVPGAALSLPGTIAGQRFYLHRPVDTGGMEDVPVTSYSLVRIGAGAATTIPTNAIFVPDNSPAYDNSLLILRMGYNNKAEFQRIIADHVAFFQWHKPFFSRVLVIDQPIANFDDATAVAQGKAVSDWLAQNATAYGYAFFSAQKYVSSYQAFVDAGLPRPADGSADAQAIALGKSPPSLTLDGLHGNDAQYSALAPKIVEVLRARKWIA